MSEPNQTPETNPPETPETDNETPQERFKSAATKRTKGVLKSMDQLAMLGSSRYQYTNEQLDIIFRVLEAKMKEVRQHLDFAQNSSSDFEL